MNLMTGWLGWRDPSWPVGSRTCLQAGIKVCLPRSAPTCVLHIESLRQSSRMQVAPGPINNRYMSRCRPESIRMHPLLVRTSFGMSE